MRIETATGGREIVVRTALTSAAKPALVVYGLVAAGVAASVVAVALGSPLDIHRANLRSAIETLITLSASIGAVLFGLRLAHTRRLRDLLLSVALACVAVTDFVFEAMPAFGDTQTATFGVWARLACLLLVTGALLAAAYTPPQRPVARGRWLVWVLASAGIGVVALGELLDVAIGPRSQAGSVEAYEPLVTALAPVAFCGLIVAGVGFVRRARRHDTDAWLLAGASCLLALASLQRLVLALEPADWVTLAEPLRLLAYGLLLTAAVRHYGGARRVQEAVDAERVRIAHDLHDGLAQDLAFIAAYADRLERRLGEDPLLGVAARRALAASRGTIVDLEASKAPSTAAALREVAAESEARFGVRISVVAPTISEPELSAADRSALVRIAREAIANAIRHGGAKNIVVTLGSRRSELLLRISDDGCGLDDPAAREHAGTGLGMRTMRTRARGLGGRLVARRRDAGGTEITVVAKRSPTARRRQH